MSQTIVLSLQGLSCDHCIKRVKDQLESRADVETVQVELNSATVTGSAAAPELIDSVKQAGYDAAVANADIELQLTGLSCDHCVAATRRALLATAGVNAAVVTLNHASIFGPADIQTVIDAVKQAGYGASLAGNPAGNIVSPKFHR